MVAKHIKAAGPRSSRAENGEAPEGAPRPLRRDIAMLSLNNVEVIYDSVILVLKGVSSTCAEGGITTLLGANGAGKTTTLKAISGVLRTERGEVTKGSVELNGQRIDRLPPYEVVRRGVVQVFEGRRVFEHLTTEENLVAGAHTQPDRGRVAAGIERVYQYFPRLKERRDVQAGLPVGRRAADAGDRAGPDVRRRKVDAPRRALARAGAHARRGDLRDRRSASTSRRSSPCCWSSRTPPWRSPSPTTAT